MHYLMYQQYILFHFSRSLNCALPFRNLVLHVKELFLKDVQNEAIPDQQTVLP